MSGWYVIQTKQLKEDLASINLTKQNFSVYSPLIESCEIKRFCKKNSKKPLFPSYIFVFISSIKESWKKITYTRGVRKIITIGDSFIPLPNDLIEALRKKEQNGTISLSKIKDLKIGDPCKINQGALINQECILSKFCSKERVKVLFTILGRHIKCVISRKFLEPKFDA